MPETYPLQAGFCYILLDLAGQRLENPSQLFLTLPTEYLTSFGFPVPTNYPPNTTAAIFYTISEVAEAPPIPQYLAVFPSSYLPSLPIPSEYGVQFTKFGFGVDVLDAINNVETGFQDYLGLSIEATSVSPGGPVSETLYSAYDSDPEWQERVAAINDERALADEYLTEFGYGPPYPNSYFPFFYSGEVAFRGARTVDGPEPAAASAPNTPVLHFESPPAGLEPPAPWYQIPRR